MKCNVMQRNVMEVCMHVSMNTLIPRFKAENQPLAGDLRKTYPHFEELQTHGKANRLKLAAHLQFV